MAKPLILQKGKTHARRCGYSPDNLTADRFQITYCLDATDDQAITFWSRTTSKQRAGSSNLSGRGILTETAIWTSTFLLIAFE